MVKRARKDWENCDTDPDTGNYYEFLSMWYRFRHWDGWYTFKRAVMYHSLLELRWYRQWRYRRTHRSV